MIRNDLLQLLDLLVLRLVLGKLHGWLREMNLLHHVYVVLDNLLQVLLSLHEVQTLKRLFGRRN